MKKSTVYTALLFLGALGFSAALAESWMRAFYTPTPAFNANEIESSFENYDYTPSRNKMGFREADIKDDVFEDSYKRILFLGDSFTFGRGITKGEDRFSDIIEARLNRESRGSGLKYHVYNAGVNGSNPRKWVRHLGELLPRYNPQYVFAIFFLRDGTNLCTSLTCHKNRITKLKKRYEDTFWYKHSYVGKYVGNAIVRRKFSSYYLSKMKRSYLGSENEMQPWHEQQAYLKELADICKRRGIEFRLVIFPLLFGLESDYKFYDVEDEISRFATSQGIPVFSLTKGFIGKDSRSLWVSPSDQHPNELGHRIAADTLYPYLSEAINLQRSRTTRMNVQ